MSYINTKLENHFGSKVDIEPVLKAEADKIYSLVKYKVKNYISDYKDNAVTVVDMGSSSDGLKVVAPDEYDVMLVVKTTELEAFGSSDVPGYYTLNTPRIIFESMDYGYRWIDLDKCMSHHRLKPDLVRRSFESMMHNVVNYDRSYNLHMRKSGPAIEVGVKWSGGSMTIDFVPAVKIRGEYFVARPLPYQDFNNVKNREFLWRKSYIQEEKEEVSGFDKNLRKAVMLWKAAQLHSPQLQMLSSYHFKTIGMMLTNTTRGYSLEDCVIAVGEELIAALRSQNLPCFFDPGVNLLHRKGSDSLDNLRNHLTRNLQGDMLLKLLGVQGKENVNVRYIYLPSKPASAHVRESLYVNETVHVKEGGGSCTSCCYCFCMFIMIVIAIVMFAYMS